MQERKTTKELFTKYPIFWISRNPARARFLFWLAHGKRFHWWHLDSDYVPPHYDQNDYNTVKGTVWELTRFRFLRVMFYWEKKMTRDNWAMSTHWTFLLPRWIKISIDRIKDIPDIKKFRIKRWKKFEARLNAHLCTR